MNLRVKLVAKAGMLRIRSRKKPTRQNKDASLAVTSAAARHCRGEGFVWTATKSYSTYSDIHFTDLINPHMHCVARFYFINAFGRSSHDDVAGIERVDF